VTDQQLACALALAGVKSSFSFSNGNCVVVCRTPDGRVAVWNSRQADNPGRPIVFFTEAEWDAFELGARNGEFPYDQLPVAVETAPPERVLAGQSGA
jgi:Domain of unknown function (DUF397)